MELLLMGVSTKMCQETLLLMGVPTKMCPHFRGLFLLMGVSTKIFLTSGVPPPDGGLNKNVRGNLLYPS